MVTNTIDGDIGGNLVIESLQDKGKSKYDSKIGSLSGGMGNYEGSFNTREDKSKRAWINKQSGIVVKNGGNLKVGKNTQLKGAVIASGNKNNKLNFDTKTILTEDISDDDESQSKGFSVGGGIGSIPSTSIVYGKKDKEQINKSTLSGVELSVDREETSAKAQGINDDIERVQEVTKDGEKRDMT